METNNFPDRIYIPRDVEYPQFPDIWWERDPDDESNVEYVRKDTFIEKADEFISTFFHPDETELIDAVLNRFHEHIKLK